MSQHELGTSSSPPSEGPTASEDESSTTNTVVSHGDDTPPTTTSNHTTLTTTTTPATATAGARDNEERGQGDDDEEGTHHIAVVTPTDEEDDEQVEQPLMNRTDSMFSPHLLGPSTQDQTFPVVQDEVIHQPPADLKTLFTVAPRLGLYTSLIQDLLRPVAAAAAAEASSPPASPTGATDTTAAAAEDTSSSYLNRDVVMDVCRDVTSVLSSEPSLLDINIEEDETLVVVGDVHGQFHDMAHHVLNQQYEKPEGSKDRKFLFLGDYVDRGPQGVETILLLFALKIEYPNQIFLIRGNHEESQTSRIYGFLFEVRTKFNDLSVWARFNEVFCYLPLAGIVSAPGHKFFAVHGGLSPALSDVNAIRDISRMDYGGMLDNTESDIVDGLLWSDPSDAVVRFSRNERGCGYLFGPAAASEFCEVNQLDFICRAHQMTMQGYTWTHNRKVLTVFSAPNYCGVSGNLASILLVTHDWQLNFVQFAMAPSTRKAPAPSPMGGSWALFNGSLSGF